MNIHTLLTAPTQPVPADRPNTLASNTDAPDSFSQILEKAGHGTEVASPDMARSIGLLHQLGQTRHLANPVLDLLQGAPAGRSEQTGLTISLTEIMAALRPIVSKSNGEQPLTAPINGNTEQETEAENEAQWALLGLMAGVNPVPPPSVLGAAPNLAGSAPAVDSPLPGPIPALVEARAGNESLALKSQFSESRTQPPHVDTSLSTVALAETGALQGASFAQALADQANKALETEQPITAAGLNGGEATTQVQAGIELDGLANGLQPETLNVQQATLNIPPATTEPVTPLPDIPALHQIVEKVGLTTRQGETEVRLHLQPESLGQVLIQLHLADGQVSVRMLAETAQAQSLIQDHLPQLKAALTAHGLDLNSLAVAVGSDASAFDMPHRQPQEWSRESAHTPATALSGEAKPVTGPEPGSRPWGRLRRVDYQV